MPDSKKQLVTSDLSTDSDLISLKEEVARIFLEAGFDEETVEKDVSGLDNIDAKDWPLVLRMARRRAAKGPTR